MVFIGMSNLLALFPHQTFHLRLPIQDERDQKGLGPFSMNVRLVTTTLALVVLGMTRGRAKCYES